MLNEKQNKNFAFNSLLKLVILFVCLFVGLYVSTIMSKLNAEGRLANDIPINPVVFFTAIVSIVMIVLTLYQKSYPWKTKAMMFFFIFIYSVLIYEARDVTKIAVNYNVNLLLYLTMILCVFAAFPFFFGRYPFKFSGQSPNMNYVFFVTSVMWLSPLIAELIIWPKVSNMILGGHGFSDVLFFYGFWALISSYLFILIIKLLPQQRIPR